MALSPATREPRAPEPAGTTLSAEDESVLDFERRHPHPGRAKDAAIRATFGISPAAYFVRLSRVIETAEALAYDPLLVQRLQRRVAQRAQWHRGADR